MVVRTSRRLPGFRFETQPPPLTDVLPRMDVTAFVGFAASGPLHTPVVVEDVAHFTTVFGDDIPLAWDQQRGQQVYGYLAPAVRAFFRNGGRRCWVVRVAHTQTQDDLTPANALGGYAQSNYFPIPGLAQVGTNGNITPAFAQARSEGSWSDSLRISSALLSQPAAVKQVMRSDLNYVVDLALASPNDIVVGDLLRLTFPHIGHDGTYMLMMVVDTIEPVPVELPPGGISPQQRSSVRITGTVGSAIWLKTVVPASPPPVAQHAFTFTRNTTLSHPVVVAEWPMVASDQTITLSLS